MKVLHYQSKTLLKFFYLFFEFSLFAKAIYALLLAIITQLVIFSMKTK